MNFDTLNVQDVVKLEEMILKEEVLNALLDLNGDKAPGLDGFLMAF